MSVWHRLGIVVTALWVFGSGLYLWPQLSECTADGPPWKCSFIVSSDGSSLSTAFWAVPQALGFWKMGLKGNALYVILVVPILLWFTVFIVACVARWIWAGRQKPN